MTELLVHITLVLISMVIAATVHAQLSIAHASVKMCFKPVHTADS